MENVLALIREGKIEEAEGQLGTVTAAFFSRPKGNRKRRSKRSKPPAS